MDVDSIAPGLDFVRELEEQVAQSDVVLAVIGKGWLDARDAIGRRLDSPEDFVRIEIASALNQEKRVIPVLVGEARMPRADELPEAIRPLARRNAVRLTHERFRTDTQALITALQKEREGGEQASRGHKPEDQAPGVTKREYRTDTVHLLLQSWRSLKAVHASTWIVFAIVGMAGWFIYAIWPPQPFVTGPTDRLIFTGPQGGPFSPSSFMLQAKVSEPGFIWSAEKKPPWLDVEPNDNEDLIPNSPTPIRLKPNAVADRSVTAKS
jgi:hypothetical protein